MIKYNGKDIIPRLNGKELSRVMYNGKQIYPVQMDKNIVYIILKNYNHILPEKYNGDTNDILGLGIATNDKTIIVSLYKSSSDYIYGPNVDETDVSQIAKASDAVNSISNIGIESTNYLLNKYPNEQYAANYTKENTILNLPAGYLPDALDWNIFFNNIDKFNNVRTILVGEDYNTHLDGNINTCIEQSSTFRLTGNLNNTTGYGLALKSVKAFNLNFYKYK